MIVNDFEFKLVSAEDKTPFQEHQKDGKTFVEVEPDAEYFMSIRTVRPPSIDLCCIFKIDGKNLGYNLTIHSGRAESFNLGTASWSNGVERSKALKFVEASFRTRDAGIGSTMAGMGTVELKVYSAIYVGDFILRDLTLSLAAPTIQTEDQVGVSMKKNVRSAEGSSIETKTEIYDPNVAHRHYEGGEYLYSIILYYCAAPGLIAVGVLPKPHAWDLLRMTQPSDISPEAKQKLENAIISEKRNRRGNLILELADSDSDSEKENDDHPDETLPNHKNIRGWNWRRMI